MTTTTGNADTPYPTPGLLDHTAIVTGSTSGIGAAIAHTLAARGAYVVISGRDAVRGQAVVEDIRDAGGRADPFPADQSGACAEVDVPVPEARRWSYAIARRTRPCTPASTWSWLRATSVSGYRALTG